MIVIIISVDIYHITKKNINNNVHNLCTAMKLIIASACGLCVMIIISSYYLLSSTSTYSPGFALEDIL